jgi:hypothetical protein
MKYSKKNKIDHRSVAFKKIKKFLWVFYLLFDKNLIYDWFCYF